jgi:hypothetical protein
MLALLFLPPPPAAEDTTTSPLRLLCASAASDASVIIWGGDSSCLETEGVGGLGTEGVGGLGTEGVGGLGVQTARGWQRLQVIPGGENVTLALSLGCIVRENGHVHVFLAAGGTGGGVRLFSFNMTTGLFDAAANLTGAPCRCCCRAVRICHPL